MSSDDSGIGGGNAVGKIRSAIANTCSLLTPSEEIQDSVEQGEITSPCTALMLDADLSTILHNLAVRS